MWYIKSNKTTCCTGWNNFCLYCKTIFINKTYIHIPFLISWLAICKIILEAKITSLLDQQDVFLSCSWWQCAVCKLFYICKWTLFHLAPVIRWWQKQIYDSFHIVVWSDKRALQCKHENKICHSQWIVNQKSWNLKVKCNHCDIEKCLILVLCLASLVTTASLITLYDNITLIRNAVTHSWQVLRRSTLPLLVSYIDRWMCQDLFRIKKYKSFGRAEICQSNLV